MPTLLTPPVRAGSLIIVADDADFPVPRVPAGTQVWRWTEHETGVRHHFTGDPAALETYAWARALPDLGAIVAVESEHRSAAAAAAIRAINASALVMVVDTGAARARAAAAAADALVRHIDTRTVLQRGLEQEWARLVTRRRVQALHAFAAPARILPILIHRDPDPDALGSALALRVLLNRTEANAPIVTLDEMTRPENRRMEELLDIQVTQVSVSELLAFDRVLCVDMQPGELLRAALPSGQREGHAGEFPRLAVVDHHPCVAEFAADYLDIRPGYGATATIVTEYLRECDDCHVSEQLATGLMYGIKTDTDSLSRGVQAADVEAYTYLLGLADAALLHRIERPALSEETARAFGRALSLLRVRGDLAVAFLGTIDIDAAHILADLADFCLALEVATWAAAAALVDGRLVITIRHFGDSPGAGDLARALARDHGTGGGHDAMARTVLRLESEWAELGQMTAAVAADWLIDRLAGYLAEL